MGNQQNCRASIDRKPAQKRNELSDLGSIIFIASKNVRGRFDRD